MPTYLDPKERKVNSEYQNLLRTILSDGVRVQTKQGEEALAVMGLQMRFPMAHGAPVITERSIKGFVSKAIGELCAFLNGARTLAVFEEYGCTWWDPWATPEKCISRGLEPGDLGFGSYGPAYRHFSTVEDDAGFDQLPHAIKKIKDLPLDRTAWVSTWIPQFNHREKGVKSRNTIAPCHGNGIHFVVLNGNLHMVHVQRSGDTPIGVPSNMVQYAAMGLMVEHLTGYRFVEFVHFISYAHIYVNQIDGVREMLSREPRPLPTLRLTEEGERIDDIHDFRGEHFEVVDYDPHPSITGIPVMT